MTNGGSTPLYAITLFEGNDVFSLSNLGELALLYSQKDRTVKIAAAKQLLAELGPDGLEIFGTLRLPGVLIGKGFIEIDGVRLNVRGVRGIQGPQGNVGSEGPQGISIRGEIGPQGKSIVGPPGKDGIDGKSIKGDTGDRGPQGERGDSIVGPPGQSIRGPQGFEGKSIVGPQGSQGKSIEGPPGKSIKGDKGDAGPQGEAVRGARGVRGQVGVQGEAIVGPQGDKGDRGDDGRDGPQGEAITGREGPQGKRGEKGERGLRGPQGFTARDGGGGLMIGGGIGPQGARGAPGVGTQGPQGADGGAGAAALDDLTDVNVPAPNDDDILSWDLGSGQWIAVPAAGGAGPQGDQGEAGPQGDQGAASTVQGPQGTQGNTGAGGPQGTQGNTGGTGPQGNQGGSGPQGDDGGTGPQGNQGTQGTAGGTGPQGNQGTQGNTGAGGPQGTQGTQGNTGGTGPQGNQGTSGGTGPQGDQGEPGPAYVFAERATQAIAAATTVSVTDGTPITPFTTTGNITSTAAPFMAAGRNGQLVVLRNDNGSGTLTLSDTNIGAGGSLLRLSANTITMAAGSSLCFEYSDIQGAWVEQYYLALVAVTPAILTHTINIGAGAANSQNAEVANAGTDTPTFAWTFTGVPSSGTVDVSAGGDAGTDYPHAIAAPYTSLTSDAFNKGTSVGTVRTFTPSIVVNGVTLTTPTATVTYINRRYMGPSAQTATLTTAQILGLDADAHGTSALSTSATGTFSVNIEAGEYLWYAYRSALRAVLYLTLGGEIAAFVEKQTDVDHTNDSGFVEHFDTWRATTGAVGAVSAVVSTSAGNNRFYMGPSTDTDPISNANILALDDTADGESGLYSTQARTWSAIKIEAGEYLWYCHPDRIADLATIKDGTTGFAIAGSYRTNVSHTNQYGYVEDYRCWRSDNTGIYPAGENIVIT